MQRLINFDDFLLDKLFENTSNNPLLFRLSPRLFKLLQTIDNPIAKDLLDINHRNNARDITLVDYDETDIGKFTYVLSSKLYDYISQKHHKDDPYSIYKLLNLYLDQGIRSEIWKLFRTSSRIGGFVNRMFQGKYVEKEVESFVNAVKAKRSQKFENFKIVKGEDIRKYYLYDNYDIRAGESTLGSSCMRHRKCQPFFDFYIVNNVEMVVLMSDDDRQKDKIMGRAILWNIKNIDGKPVDRKFMDRIYTISDHDTQTFKDYATKNGWLYKLGQNRNTNEPICDPTDNNNCRERSMITDTNFKKTKYFPYLDTMSFFYWKDGYLSNDGNLVEDTSEQPYFLQNAHGAYTISGMKYVAFYQTLIPEEDLQWCEYGHDWRYHDEAVYLSEYSEHATRQYLEEHDFKYSNIQGRWLNPSDDNIIHLDFQDDYVTEDYADRYMTYCEYDGQYYDRDHVVYSEYHQSYIPKHNTVSVITSDDHDTDWRVTDDDTYIGYIDTNGYEPKQKYYDKDVFGDKFILCIDKTYRGRSWKHKEWDKDKLTEYNGRWYWNMTQEDIENYIKKNG